MEGNMSTGTVEVELLDVDLDASVPCETPKIVFYTENGEEVGRETTVCGKPSVARIRYYCPCWAAIGPKYQFTCKDCLDSVRSKDSRMQCQMCRNRDFEWKES
jgi:hypothetical protein